MIKRITHLSVLAAPLFFYAQHTKTDTTSVGTIQEVSLQGTKASEQKIRNRGKASFGEFGKSNGL